MVAAQPDDPAADPTAGVRRPPSRALDLAGLDASMYAEITAGGPRAFDGSFWRERAPASYLARVVRNRVPALLLSGWFDVYQRGVVLDYAALQNAYAAAKTQADSASVDARQPLGDNRTDRGAITCGELRKRET